MGTNGIPSPPPPQVSPQMSPRLSSTQRSYREDPDGFLARLEARAQTLFGDGYTVAPVRETAYAFRVSTPPDGRGLVCRYDVNPEEGTCTCPFYARQAAKGEYLTDNGEIVACKHLRGLAALVRAMRRRHAKENDPNACGALWLHWMLYLAHRRRERMEREKRERQQERRREQERYGRLTLVVSTSRTTERTAEAS